MMNEYAIVRAAKQLSEKVPEHTLGTVLIKHDENNYEVEFVNEEGETLGILTVSIADISMD